MPRPRSFPVRFSIPRQASLTSRLAALVALLLFPSPAAPQSSLNVTGRWQGPLNTPTDPNPCSPHGIQGVHDAVLRKPNWLSDTTAVLTFGGAGCGLRWAASSDRCTTHDEQALSSSS